MAMAWPDAFRIADHLEAMPASEVPPEVEAALLSLGFPALKEVRKHKVSFHATYFLNFESGEGVVLQLLGSELGDKALFDLQRPISAGSIARASELAQEAGLRVPKVLATGEVDKWGPLHDVPFVVYELIKTATVEDEVVAPKQDLFSVIAALRETLGRRSLADVDTEPLPRFEDCFAFIAYLQELSEQIQASELVECCTKMSKTLRDSGLTSAAPVLVHQDLNDGNVLCSPDCNGTWQLDALIDWEGAVVVDARVAYEKGEPWQSLRTLAKVIKTRWMMAGMAGSLKLPRCCAEELVEDYEMLCSSLVESGWLPQVQPLSSLAKQV